jgi:hypothetical protein
MTQRPILRKPAEGRSIAVVDRPAKMLISVAPAGLERMFLEVGVPLAEGATNTLPPTKEEIEKLLAIAPRYGIEITLPGH